MTKSLYEICLENIGKNCLLYNSIDLAQQPLTVLQDLLKYVSAKNLDLLEAHLKCRNIDFDRIWKNHYKIVWSPTLDEINSNEGSYKCRYFEYLFSNTRALEVDLSVNLNNNQWEHVLNLSLNMIEKYNIKKDRIEFNPISVLRQNGEKEKWNLKWNMYIERLSLAQNIWHIVRSNESYIQNFFKHVKTLSLNGYPQRNDLQALKFVVKLLSEGNVSHLVVKFPQRALLKIITSILSCAGKCDYEFTLNDMKFPSRTSITLKNEIRQLNHRPVNLWRTIGQMRRSIRSMRHSQPNMNNSIYYQLRNNFMNSRQSFNRPRSNENVGYCSSSERNSVNYLHFNCLNGGRSSISNTDHDQESSGLSISQINSVIGDITYPQVNRIENFDTNEISSSINEEKDSKRLSEISNKSNESKESKISSLYTIDEEECTFENKVLFRLPKNSKLSQIHTLDIYYSHRKANVELLSQTLLEMQYLQNLSISYVSPYSIDLEHTLIELVRKDKLKSLSLNSIRLTFGAVGFLQQILTIPQCTCCDQTIECGLQDENLNEEINERYFYSPYAQPAEIKCSDLKPLKLVNLKLEMIKSYKPEVLLMPIDENCRKTNIKKLIWRETEFTQKRMQMLCVMLKHSDLIEHLDVKSIHKSDLTKLFLKEILSTCTRLKELFIRNFTINLGNSLDKLIELLEKNQLIQLHIESCNLFNTNDMKFIESLKYATNLQVLSLSNNDIRDVVGYRLCELLSNETQKHPLKLHTMDLSFNNLTINSLRTLCETIKQLKLLGKCRINCLKVSNNDCDYNLAINLKNSYKNFIKIVI